MPFPSLFDPTTCRLAAQELSARDRRLAAVLAQTGPPQLPPQPCGGPFGYLVQSVVYQQLGMAAAAAIHERLILAVGDRNGRITPGALSQASPAQLAGAGLSSPKQKTLRGLAEAVLSGRFHPGALSRSTDEVITARLTALSGIGPWTVQMFLLFYLGRTDVWPSGDLGIRHGMAQLWGETGPFSPGRVAEAGEAWRPWRSAAAWALWHWRTKAPPGLNRPARREESKHDA